MKRKLLSLALLVMLAFCLAAPVGAFADGQTAVPRAAIEGQTDWPEFEPVEGENSTEIEVKPADKRTATGWGIAYIVLIPVGAVVCGGLAVLFFVKKKKDKTEEKKNGVRLCSQILTLVFAFTVLAGTGIFGVSGLLEERHNPLYYYAGATASKSAAPDAVKGFTEGLTNRKVLSTFDFGLESKYDRVYSNFPHFWNTSSPKHNYSTVSLSSKNSYKYEYAYEEDDGDGANVWYVLSADDKSDVGDNYYADAEYRLTMNSSDGETNYVDTSIYDKMRLVFKAENAGKPVNLTVIADTRRKEAKDEDDLAPVRYELGTYEGKSGEKVEITLNMGSIAPEDRPYLSRIIFRTNNEDIAANSEKSCQKNSLYYLELYSTAKTENQAELAGVGANEGVTLGMQSEYLGSYGYSLYGAYSASGFYDTSDGKWKIWYGAGIPENIASDNVYYMETTDLNKGWSQPTRLILNDPTGKMTAANKAPGYGGGSPSVVYKDGEFWMYYYTQAPDYRYPQEPCGLVLKKSTDGIHFGEGIEINRSMSTMDVKYIPSLKKWVSTYYAEENQFMQGAKAGVRIAFSDNGVDWDFDYSNEKMIAQNFDYPINHNPGFIGNELGQGYETMFLTYGANDLPLTVDGYWFSAAQYDARQLEWSRITIK